MWHLSSGRNNRLRSGIGTEYKPSKTSQRLGSVRNEVDRLEEGERRGTLGCDDYPFLFFWFSLPSHKERDTITKVSVMAFNKTELKFFFYFKRCLLLGRKVMTNLDSILKSRYVTLPTKVRLVKAMVFPVVTYGCESWTAKKAGHRRIDAFELWCWRRLLRIPWTARRSSQLILKEIDPEYSLKGLILKLKLQSFGHLRSGWRTDSLEQTLMLGKIEGKRGRGWQRIR